MHIVIALGGNALGNTPLQQQEILKQSVKPIADLIQEGHQITLTHGNGPQVGMVLNAFENEVELPTSEATAMTQGYIGYQLQQALRNEFTHRKMKHAVTTIITQVIVDANDSGFLNPTKPIGPFYTLEEAQLLQQQTGFPYINDSNRGYRRVVPSPKPLKIVELESIQQLINAQQVVITVGGGGIPVVLQNNQLKGVDAVIDKDFASACLAQSIHADFLVILTAVEKVAINYQQPNQQWLSELTVSDARKRLQENHFASGSMKPKVEAAIQFVESGPNKKALITSLEKATLALKGLTGTIITA